MPRSPLWLMPLGVVLLCMAGGARAAIIVGDANAVSYDERIVVSRCRTAVGSGTVRVRLLPGRKWRLYGETNYSGRFSADSSGRRLTLTMDATSEKRFVGVLRRAASALCGLPVTVQSVSAITIKARISGDDTRLSGTVRASGRGRTREGSGSARYSGSFSGSFVRR